MHSLAVSLFTKLSWEEPSWPQADFRQEEAQSQTEMPNGPGLPYPLP